MLQTNPFACLFTILYFLIILYDRMRLNIKFGGKRNQFEISDCHLYGGSRLWYTMSSKSNKFLIQQILHWYTLIISQSLLFNYGNNIFTLGKKNPDYHLQHAINHGLRIFAILGGLPVHTCPAQPRTTVDTCLFWYPTINAINNKLHPTIWLLWSFWKLLILLSRDNLTLTSSSLSNAQICYTVIYWNE